MKHLLICLLAMLIIAGCSSGRNPIDPTGNPEISPPTDSPSSSFNDGPGNPVIPEEGTTVKVEAHPSFSGFAYIGYPTQFRAIAWKNEEIVGFVGTDFDLIDQQNFAWEGADENGVLTPTSTGKINISVTYKGVKSNSIIVEMIEPQVAEIQLIPYWPITMYLGDILSPFTIRVIDIGGGLITTDPTRVTWIGGPDATGVFQPTDVGVHEIYAKADNGVESGHMILEVVEL